METIPEGLLGPRKKSNSFNNRFTEQTRSLTRLNPESILKKSPLQRSQSTASIENVLHNAVLREDHEAVVQILNNNFLDINALSIDGFTSLHQACIVGNEETVKLLIEAGADITLRTRRKKHESPLKLAYLNGNFEVAEYLLSLGAHDAEIKNGMSKKCFGRANTLAS
eukprot:TCONS_00004395-protein